MNWQQLISSKRFGQENRHIERHDDRSEFKRDYDRLIFSAPFRRLQNKTQVFPLPGSIFVHNRLTHSLEVASVGMSLGNDVAKDIVRETVFNLAVDRSNQIREKSLAQGKKADTVADFMSDIDLPFEGWIPEWGEDHCPYAEVWRTYYEKYPWFREFAPFYCDVIDTTTIENYSKCLSHRITQNVLNEGTACLREYFESDSVKKGEYTYG